MEKGYGFISVEYRMYPDAKSLDFLEDGSLILVEKVCAFLAQEVILP